HTGRKNSLITICDMEAVATCHQDYLMASSTKTKDRKKTVTTGTEALVNTVTIGQEAERNKLKESLKGIESELHWRTETQLSTQ
uniref:Uncharacterized protein n=1 Tax=Stegastes partitus TaxID=144197 RepID=A0A3B5BDX4_9TELE